MSGKFYWVFGVDFFVVQSGEECLILLAVVFVLVVIIFNSVGLVLKFSNCFHVKPNTELDQCTEFYQVTHLTQRPLLTEK